MLDVQIRWNKMSKKMSKLEERIQSYRIIEVKIIAKQNKIEDKKNKIEELQSMVESCTSNTTSFKFSVSDCNSFERKINKYLSEKDDLQKKIEILEKEIHSLEKEYGLLTKAFETLSKNELTVIEEYYLKRTSIQDIAYNIIHYSERQVANIKKYALNKLRTALDEK